MSQLIACVHAEESLSDSSQNIKVIQFVCVRMLVILKDESKSKFVVTHEN